MDKAHQVGGDHYAKRKIQPWDVIEEYNLDFWLGNVIKYVLRARDKNGLEDLRKAQHYLAYRIELAERDPGLSREPYSVNS